MTIIVLFWIMAIMDGWRGIKGRGLRSWLQTLVAIAQYLSSNFIGPESAGHYLFAGITALPDAVPQTLAASACIPFGDLGASQVDMTLAHTGYTAGQVLRAWTPFLFLTATVTVEYPAV